MNEQKIINLISQLNESVISMLNEISFVGISESSYTVIESSVKLSKLVIGELENELNGE